VRRLPTTRCNFRWIVTLKGNLDIVYDERADVFVAGDLFWYPVEGESTIVQAPDVLVAFGRPKGERRSYKQWEEGRIAPQVVFEILSHNNTMKDLLRKFAFYEKYGVEEYYIYDPEKVDLSGFQRVQGRLEEITEMNGWLSPRLQCRFQIVDNDLVLLGPDGERFLTFVELGQRAKAFGEQLERARKDRQESLSQKEEAILHKEEALKRTVAADQAAQKLREQLRALEGKGSLSSANQARSEKWREQSGFTWMSMFILRSGTRYCEYV
jgi:Uma2 family endonuclease